MIKFNRDDNKVKIHIEHGVFGNGEQFTLEIAQGYNYQAALLTQAFQENLNRHLKDIKKKYYEMGWKDCRKRGVKVKDRKQTEFWGGWEKF